MYGLSSNRNEEVAMKVAETINRGKNPFAAEVALALGDFGSSALGTLPQLFFVSIIGKERKEERERREGRKGKEEREREDHREKRRRKEKEG